MVKNWHSPILCSHIFFLSPLSWIFHSLLALAIFGSLKQRAKVHQLGTAVFLQPGIPTRTLEEVLSFVERWPRRAECWTTNQDISHIEACFVVSRKRKQVVMVSPLIQGVHKE